MSSSSVHLIDADDEPLCKTRNAMVLTYDCYEVTCRRCKEHLEQIIFTNEARLHARLIESQDSKCLQEVPADYITKERDFDHFVARKRAFN